MHHKIDMRHFDPHQRVIADREFVLQDDTVIRGRKQSRDFVLKLAVWHTARL